MKLAATVSYRLFVSKLTAPVSSSLHLASLSTGSPVGMLSLKVPLPH